MHILGWILETIALLGCFSSCVYYLVVLWSTGVFARTRKIGQSILPGQNPPPVSILKPLKGIDPEIYESFRSHCQQDYPKYEIIFGVSDPDDPAIARVEDLRREFPDRPIQLIVCKEILGPNVKVSNLEQMVAFAKYDHLIVN